MKKTLIYFISILALGCGNNKTQYVAKVKLHTLAQDEIFNKDKVYNVIFDAEELKIDSLKNASRQLFLKGAEAYKNKKNSLDEAITYFKKSILVFPDAKTYYELANALVDRSSEKNNLKIADSAYEVAEHLDFQPSSMLHFKRACLCNINENQNHWETVNYLRQAFNEGFRDTAQIKGNDRIKSIVLTDEYRNLMIELQSGKFKNNESGLFGLYAKSFPSISQPFEITLDNLELSDYSRSISFEFSNFIPEMQNTSFGRDVSHDYYYVGNVAETDKYVALIYKSVNFEGEAMQPIIEKIVTYDKQGNIISSKFFAGQFSAEKVKKGRIENNTIYIEDYKRTWKKPIDEVSFDENQVDKYELIAKAEYLIDDTGKILEKSVPPNYTDSSMFVKK